ncbi:hypothetical protein BXY47_0061 [Dietzia kunjamensis]|uniref:hypothetical protein n=1 Tax=Dietzia kunjamensis TaxID=322509 RepID=UPI000FF03521|nr:hypothetical protein [Dietzia kunjamensis]RKE68956.1 hypothetical protein BXY47_0061 [Dietzia kunjamensis]
MISVISAEREDDEVRQDAEPATPDDTRRALLVRNRRTHTPIANGFVQNPDRSAPSREGPLATFVRNGDLRGLHAYLLVSAVTSSDARGEGWSTTLPLPVWARAFGTTSDAEPKSATTAASKILRRLEGRQLVERHRSGRPRNVRVTLLSADGSGKPYTRPNSHFFKLHNDYWLAGWHQRLDLPATAMLLVLLHEQSGCEIPTERMRKWYGFSPDTAERGVRTLRENGLLAVQQRFKTAPLAPAGITRVNQYFLLPPFGKAPEWLAHEQGVEPTHVKDPAK